MKKIKTPFLFIFLFFLIAFGSYNGLAKSENRVSSYVSSENITNLINSDTNQTIYYIYLDEPSLLEINVKVLDWGELTPETIRIAGLKVELLQDGDSAVINGWLVQINDLMEHYFSSEVMLNGTIQVRFSVIGVESSVIEWKLNLETVMWTYSAAFSVNTISDFFFGLERSLEYYSAIDNILVDIKLYNGSNNSLIYLYLMAENAKIIKHEAQVEVINDSYLFFLQTDNEIEQGLWYSIALNFTYESSLNSFFRINLYFMIIGKLKTSLDYFFQKVKRV